MRVKTNGEALADELLDAASRCLCVGFVSVRWRIEQNKARNPNGGDGHIASVSNPDEQISTPPVYQRHRKSPPTKR